MSGGCVMARGNKKDIPVETKKHIIHLYYNLHHKQADIARELRICLNSVKNVLSRYRRESQGGHVPTLRVRGRLRILRAADVDGYDDTLRRALPKFGFKGSDSKFRILDRLDHFIPV
ncbi:hypothetical protein B0H13DRAFT_1912066 [Mycena leptocephala]|nr:hypothetical protein B0H13DRAFT_1912066 [Mycena leptocephala]